MASSNRSSDPILRWHVDDIPYDRVEAGRVAGDTDLFHHLAGASFVEIASDIYTGSLCQYYADDEAIATWLRQEWEPQELQHGEALRRYVTAVWPEFDWGAAYTRFRQDYAPLCAPELLGPTRAQELLARCVVETGTATFYTMLHAATDEPVLRQITSHIRTDEVGHYGHFFQHFKRYRNDEGLGRLRILRTSLGRVAEFDSEDIWYAFRAIHEATAGKETTAAAYRGYRQRSRTRMHRHYPYAMASKMLLKPMALHQSLARLAVPVLASGGRHLF